MSHPNHHPPEEWEARRAEISKLYIDEDNTLQHVMRVMREKGFTATQKMYKTKLKQWKLFKNNRAADVAAILRSLSQRTAVGKESIPVRNGRRIDTQAYLRRKGVSANDLLQLAAASSMHDLPIHLRCITPPPADPMTGVLRNSPGRLGVKEVIGKWILGECERLGDSMAMEIDSGVECEPPEKERPLLVYYESSASKVAAEYYTAIWLLQKSQSPQGWALANAVFSRLHTLLDDCEHLLYPILNLLMSILILPPKTSEIHKALWDYLSSYALIRCGSGHPVHRMLRQLTDLFEQDSDDEERYGLLHSIVSDAVSALDKRRSEGGQTGQMYYDLVSLWYAETLRSHRGHQQGYCPQLSLDQEEMSSILDDPAGYDHDQVVDLGLNTVHSYLLLDYGWQTSWRDPSVYSSCIALINAKEQTDTSPDETEVNCFTAMALYHRAQVDPKHAPFINGTAIARCNEQQQQHHELARHLLQEAVSLDWELSGASIYNFEGLLLLQEWCAEAEDWMGLEIVRQRSEECLGALFQEWGVGSNGTGFASEMDTVVAI